MKIPSSVNIGAIPVVTFWADAHHIEESTGVEGAIGMYSFTEKAIGLRPDLSETEEITTYFHELAHAVNDLVISSKAELTEMEIDFLGNVLNQIVIAFLEEQEIEISFVVEDGGETEVSP